jgi:hypothetical protein
MLFAEFETKRAMDNSLINIINPLTAGLGRIGPRHFLNCPYKKPVNLKI